MNCEPIFLQAETISSAAVSASPATGFVPGRIRNDEYELEDEDVSDEEGIDEATKASEAYRELMWLKRIRREKEREQQLGDEQIIHRGFRCDGCNVEPIVGGRFQCSECLNEDTVDFCVECAPRNIEVGKHTKDHTLKPVRKKMLLSMADRDYSAPSNSGGTKPRNYLDPNFMH